MMVDIARVHSHRVRYLSSSFLTGIFPLLFVHFHSKCAMISWGTALQHISAEVMVKWTKLNHWYWTCCLSLVLFRLVWLNWCQAYEEVDIEMALFCSFIVLPKLIVCVLAKMLLYLQNHLGNAWLKFHKLIAVNGANCKTKINKMSLLFSLTPMTKIKPVHKSRFGLWSM